MFLRIKHYNQLALDRCLLRFEDFWRASLAPLGTFGAAVSIPVFNGLVQGKIHSTNPTCHEKISMVSGEKIFPTKQQSTWYVRCKKSMLQFLMLKTSSLLRIYATRKGALLAPVKMAKDIAKWGRTVVRSKVRYVSKWTTHLSLLEFRKFDMKPKFMTHVSEKNSCPIGKIKSQTIRVCPFRWDITTRRNALHLYTSISKKCSYHLAFLVYKTHTHIFYSTYVCMYVYIYVYIYKSYKRINSTKALN